MFYKYEIQNNGNEDILYLYLSMKYEFSQELSFDDNKDLGRRTKNFITTNHIPFHGDKVYLIVDGIIVKTLRISDFDTTPFPNNEYSCHSFVVNIQLEDHSLSEITLKDYLISVLFSKYMDSLPDEVLKSMCVLYNTYAYKMMKEENYISANNSFAIYKPISYYKSCFDTFQDIFTRLENIVISVDGMFLSYQNNYILPFMHYSNNGKTLSNSKYPYLSSVKSLWDLASPYYVEIHDFSYDEIGKILNISIQKNSHISMFIKDHVRKIVLGDVIYTVEEFKTLLGLKSEDIYLIINSDSLRIITKGWGNSLGLSIFGACEIAKNGSKYYNILKYFFPKVKLYKYVKELS